MTFEEAFNAINYAFVEMLYLAEGLFGQGNKEWIFTGIVFRADGPYVMYYPDKKRIAIVLSSGCSNSFPSSPQLYFQLAHETCHLLYPTGEKEANILEEGISTYFSKVYQELKYPNSTYAIDCIKKSKYAESFELVEKLISQDPDCIKKIRQINPIISYITEEELSSLYFNLSEEERKRLVSKFQYIS